jgi:toluene monooxygenase system ferredoxin subunit
VTSRKPQRLLLARELWAGELVGLDAAGCPVLLARVGERVLAYRDRCPHQGVRLSEGRLSGTIVTCRAHHFEFDLASGRCQNPRTLALDPLPISIEDGYVVLGGEAGAP